MKLVVVSHTPHYLRDGVVVGWGPTVREISHLASLFDRVVHVAPVHGGVAPASALAYACQKITVLPIRSAGGAGWRDKLQVLASVPEYVRAIRCAARDADVLHIRCPANVSLVALALAANRRWFPGRVWVKYAGDWSPHGDDFWSFRLQRAWLTRASRFVVTINGSWPSQPSHIQTMLNPCLTAAELADAKTVTASKAFSQPVQLLFVGSLVEAKGAMTAVDILRELLSQGIKAELDMIGDGPLRPAIEYARSTGMPVRHHGWMSRGDVGRFYEQAHFILLPSRGEGWPKVLSEAMAYGVIPLASATGSIPETLKRFRIGVSIAEASPSSYAAELAAYAEDPTRWRRESGDAVAAAANFAYGPYLAQVRDLVLAREMLG